MIFLPKPKCFCIIIVVLLFLNPTHLVAQDITGVWKGTISTNEKELLYELAITENDGKYTGYSYTRFNVKGVEMMAVKSIKVKNINGSVTVSDDELIFDSFKEEAAKQVKQTDELNLKAEGENLTLTGKFKTKGTRQFRPLGGNIFLVKQKDIKETAIAPTLDSLQLLQSLSFMKRKPIPATVKVTAPVALKANSIDRTIAVNTLPVLQQQKVTKKISTDTIVAAPVVAVTPPMPVTPKPVPVKTTVVAVAAPVKKIPETVAPKEIVKTTPAVQKPVPAKPIVSTAEPVVQIPKPTVATPVVVKPINDAAPVFTAQLAKRNIETIQTVYFKTDSLQLTLYDNGEVDGDTVSVILNGRMIMPKEGLSTKAISKMIYITPDMGDSLQLVMYAENLGSLPPNTGLLIINDGKERYEIRFAGDLTKNAAIILRRRKL